ncbi:MAG: hypothetical protein OEW21_15080, partial [Betaproteobacteria bacterium]|nr:hypothetical protein [Betaproteobacteria bacterium]
MTERRLLYFTSQGHDLYRAARGGLRLEASFAPDGVADLRAYLRAHSGVVFSVLADLAGEDFQEEQIPFLRGAERQAVLGRRLAQRYRDTRLATALSLGYVRDERRNERLLLASFTDPQQFAPWLGAIAESGAKLAGVYSVPLLAPALAVRLGLRDHYGFLATFTRAGLRQCFLEHGKLRFARLQALDDRSPRALAARLREETDRLSQYLTTLRALPRDGPAVPVAVVAPVDLAQELERELDRSVAAEDRVVFRVIGMDRARRAAGLRHPPQTPGAELLYLALAVKTPPVEQYAPRAERSSFFFWRIQRALIAAGALGLSVGALYAGGLWRETYEARER